MRYNMDFLVAALIFLIVLWHHFMKQRQYAGNKTEKTFQIFMMLGIGDILLDMVSTVVIDNSRPDRKSTRLNSSHRSQSRMPSSA